MFYELLFAIGAFLLAFYLPFHRFSHAKEGARTPFNQQRFSGAIDRSLSLYNEASQLFIRGYYAAAAEKVLGVTASESEELAANAWLMLALCHLQLTQLNQVVDAAGAGIDLISRSEDPQSLELRRLSLNLLMLKTSALTLTKASQELLWQLYEEARALAEAPPDAFETAAARNLYLAYCYHNLGCLSEQSGEKSSASVYYERAFTLWSELSPADKPEHIKAVADNLKAARAGWLACSADYLSQMFNLNYEGPEH